MDNYVYSPKKSYRFNFETKQIEHCRNDGSYSYHDNPDFNLFAATLVGENMKYSGETCGLLIEIAKMAEAYAQEAKSWVYSDDRIYRYNTATKTLQYFNDFSKKWCGGSGEFRLVAESCAGNFGEYDADSQTLLNKLRKL